MKVVVSGIRPTGPLHIGHLMGVLDNWKKLQGEYECFFLLADWHVLTDRLNTAEVPQNEILITKQIIASGVDPEKVVLFRQAKVKEHAELFLLFSMVITVPFLERNPTIKEMLAERDIPLSFGLMGYPVLQAADILLYKAEYVPVGVDQLPHLELTREIARRFNRAFGTDFPEPEPLLSKTPKLLGIDNRKMSKSYDNAIWLNEDPADISAKISRMVTDPARVRKSDPGHPEVCNVFSWHKVFNTNEVASIEEDCRQAKIGCVQCKKRLAEVIIELTEPFREIESKISDSDVEEILRRGEDIARQRAREVMEMVRKLVKIG